MKDIAINIQEKDFLLTRETDNATVKKSFWGNAFSGDSSDTAYLNITLTSSEISSLDYTNGFAIHINASYYPYANPVVVRIVRQNTGETSPTLIRTFTTTSFYNSCTLALSINACQMPLVNADGDFLIYIKDTTAKIYSGVHTDFSILDNSSDQESQLLTLCYAGHLYRFPTIGVGATNYINSIPAHTDIASQILEQYNLDNKHVTDAEYDSTTGQLIVSFTNSDTGDDNLDLVDTSELDTALLYSGIDLTVDSSDTPDEPIRNEITFSSGSSASLTYSPGKTQQVSCAATTESKGTITYQVMSGSKYVSSFNTSTGLLVLSNTYAGGQIIVKAIFTPTDPTQYAPATKTKTIIYNKLTPTLNWASSVPDSVKVGTTVTLSASSSVSGLTIKYAVDGTDLSGSTTTLSSDGSYKMEAYTAATDVCNESHIYKVILATTDSVFAYIYTGTSNVYSDIPDSELDITDGLGYSSISTVNFDCNGHYYKTIWIAILNGKGISFDGKLYDTDNDPTQMSQVTVGNYTVYYWTQRMSMTQYYKTYKS